MRKNKGFLIRNRRRKNPSCQVVLVEQPCASDPISVYNSPPVDRTLEVQNMPHFLLHFLLDAPVDRTEGAGSTTVAYDAASVSQVARMVWRGFVSVVAPWSRDGGGARLAAKL
jgi:hypothetical protein